MINIKQAQLYCGQPIELIENYQEAVNDTEQIWHCHHVWETMLGYTRQELIELDEYYGIPACNLIFLTSEEHIRLHNQGKKLSEEHRKKISESMKGEKNYMFGKHHSEESRKKMSEFQKGKKVSEESRRKMSESKKGKKLSEEHREKLSESLKGEKHPMFGKHHSEESRKKMSESQPNRKIISQYTTDGVLINKYDSIADAARKNGFHIAAISHCVNFKTKTAYNYIWRFE